MPSILCAIGKGGGGFAPSTRNITSCGAERLPKNKKFFVKLSQEEFLDVESVQQSRGVASRRVDFGERTVAWSGRRKEGRSVFGHRLFRPKAASGNALHQLANGPRASLQSRAFDGVIRDDPWLQFPRGEEQIYKTNLLVVKMINPLLD
jgi:hypothetical protein